MIYQWKSGAHLKGDPQKVGERLEALREKHGGALTAAQVVRDAQAKSSPLHPCFEWDDSEAARKYRLAQAGHVMRCVVISVEQPHGRPIVTPLLVNIRQEESPTRVYTSAPEAFADPLLAEQIEQQAFRELRQFRQKYARVRSLAHIFAAIDAELLVA